MSNNTTPENTTPENTAPENTTPENTTPVMPPLFIAPTQPLAAPNEVEQVPESTAVPPSTNGSGAAIDPPLKVEWGGQVLNVLDPRPLPSTLQEVDVTRRQVVSAFVGNTHINVTEQAAYVITYTSTPNSWGPLKEAARHNMLQPRRPSAMRVLEIEGDMLLPALLFGPQPRTETDPSPVAPPRIRGGLGNSGEPIAEYVMEFRDQQHLEDWTREIVKSTDKQGGDYQTSIIEKGISEPITVVAGLVVLLDGGDGHPVSFSAIIVVDGITRALRSWQVHLGYDARIDDVAETIIRSTVRPTVSRRSASKSLHERVLDTRNAAVDTWRGTCINAEIEGAGTASVQAGIRTKQGFTLRARIVVGCHTAVSSQLDPEDQFPDAVAELVRFTQENKAWRMEASAANAMHGVVRSLKGAGDIDNPELADLLLGNIHRDDLVSVATAALGTNADLTASQAALYRAVFVLWFFTRHGVFERSKDSLRNSLNATRIQNARFAHSLAPLVEAPWRLHKASSLPQARNAYKRRGALTDEAMTQGWGIVVDTPMNLYRRALTGDRDARITLMTAGGVAMIADRFFTTEVVAGVGSGGGYQGLWRARSIAEVIALLGHPDNKRGLLQLALSMQEFNFEKEAVNGLSLNERERRVDNEASHFYVMHAAAEDLLDSPDGIQRVNGSEIELTTQLILLIADYDNTRRDKTSPNNGGSTRDRTLQDLVNLFVKEMRQTRATGASLSTKGSQDASRVIVDEATQYEMVKAQRALGSVLDWIDLRADKEPTVWGDELPVGVDEDPSAADDLSDIDHVFAEDDQ